MWYKFSDLLISVMLSSSGRNRLIYPLPLINSYRQLRTKKLMQQISFSESESRSTDQGNPPPSTTTTISEGFYRVHKIWYSSEPVRSGPHSNARVFLRFTSTFPICAHASLLAVYPSQILA